MAPGAVAVVEAPGSLASTDAGSASLHYILSQPQTPSVLLAHQAVPAILSHLTQPESTQGLQRNDTVSDWLAPAWVAQDEGENIRWRPELRSSSGNDAESALGQLGLQGASAAEWLAPAWFQQNLNTAATAAAAAGQLPTAFQSPNIYTPWGNPHQGSSVPHQSTSIRSPTPSSAASPALSPPFPPSILSPPRSPAASPAHSPPYYLSHAMHAGLPTHVTHQNVKSPNALSTMSSLDASDTSMRCICSPLGAPQEDNPWTTPVLSDIKAATPPTRAPYDPLHPKIQARQHPALWLNTANQNVKNGIANAELQSNYAAGHTQQGNPISFVQHSLVGSSQPDSRPMVDVTSGGLQAGGGPTADSQTSGMEAGLSQEAAQNYSQTDLVEGRTPIDETSALCRVAATDTTPQCVPNPQVSSGANASMGVVSNAGTFHDLIPNAGMFHNPIPNAGTFHDSIPNAGTSHDPATSPWNVDIAGTTNDTFLRNGTTTDGTQLSTPPPQHVQDVPPQPALVHAEPDVPNDTLKPPTRDSSGEVSALCPGNPPASPPRSGNGFDPLAFWERPAVSATGSPHAPSESGTISEAHSSISHLDFEIQGEELVQVDGSPREGTADQLDTSPGAAAVRGMQTSRRAKSMAGLESALTSQLLSSMGGIDPVRRSVSLPIEVDPSNVASANAATSHKRGCSLIIAPDGTSVQGAAGRGVPQRVGFGMDYWRLRTTPRRSISGSSQGSILGASLPRSLSPLGNMNGAAEVLLPGLQGYILTPMTVTAAQQQGVSNNSSGASPPYTETVTTPTDDITASSIVKQEHQPSSMMSTASPALRMNNKATAADDVHGRGGVGVAGPRAAEAAAYASNMALPLGCNPPQGHAAEPGTSSTQHPTPGLSEPSQGGTPATNEPLARNLWCADAVPSMGKDEQGLIPPSTPQQQMNAVPSTNKNKQGLIPANAPLEVVSTSLQRVEAVTAAMDGNASEGATEANGTYEGAVLSQDAFAQGAPMITPTYSQSGSLPPFPSTPSVVEVSMRRHDASHGGLEDGRLTHHSTASVDDRLTHRTSHGMAEDGRLTHRTSHGGPEDGRLIYRSTVSMDGRLTHRSNASMDGANSSDFAAALPSPLHSARTSRYNRGRRTLSRSGSLVLSRQNSVDGISAILPEPEATMMHISGRPQGLLVVASPTASSGSDSACLTYRSDAAVVNAPQGYAGQDPAAATHDMAPEVGLIHGQHDSAVHDHQAPVQDFTAGVHQQVVGENSLAETSQRLDDGTSSSIRPDSSGISISSSQKPDGDSMSSNTAGRNHQSLSEGVRGALSSDGDNGRDLVHDVIVSERLQKLVGVSAFNGHMGALHVGGGGASVMDTMHLATTETVWEDDTEDAPAVGTAFPGKKKLDLAPVEQEARDMQRSSSIVRNPLFDSDSFTCAPEQRDVINNPLYDSMLHMSSVVLQHAVPEMMDGWNGSQEHQESASTVEQPQTSRSGTSSPAMTPSHSSRLNPSYHTTTAASDITSTSHLPPRIRAAQLLASHPPAPHGRMPSTPTTPHTPSQAARMVSGLGLKGQLSQQFQSVMSSLDNFMEQCSKLQEQLQADRPPGVRTPAITPGVTPRATPAYSPRVPAITPTLSPRSQFIRKWTGDPLEVENVWRLVQKLHDSQTKMGQLAQAAVEAVAAEEEMDEEEQDTTTKDEGDSVPSSSTGDALFSPHRLPPSNLPSAPLTPSIAAAKSLRRSQSSIPSFPSPLLGDSPRALSKSHSASAGRGMTLKIRTVASDPTSAGRYPTHNPPITKQHAPKDGTAHGALTSRTSVSSSSSKVSAHTFHHSNKHGACDVAPPRGQVRDGERGRAGLDGGPVDSEGDMTPFRAPSADTPFRRRYSFTYEAEEEDGEEEQAALIGLPAGQSVGTPSGAAASRLEPESPFRLPSARDRQRTIADPSPGEATAAHKGLSLHRHALNGAMQPDSRQPPAMQPVSQCFEMGPVESSSTGSSQPVGNMTSHPATPPPGLPPHPGIRLGSHRHSGSDLDASISLSAESNLVATDPAAHQSSSHSVAGKVSRTESGEAPADGSVLSSSNSVLCVSHPYTPTAQRPPTGTSPIDPSAVPHSPLSPANMGTPKAVMHSKPLQPPFNPFDPHMFEPIPAVEMLNDNVVVTLGRSPSPASVKRRPSLLNFARNSSKRFASPTAARRNAAGGNIPPESPIASSTPSYVNGSNGKLQRSNSLTGTNARSISPAAGFRLGGRGGRESGTPTTPETTSRLTNFLKNVSGSSGRHTSRDSTPQRTHSSGSKTSSGADHEQKHSKRQSTPTRRLAASLDTLRGTLRNLVKHHSLDKNSLGFGRRGSTPNQVHIPSPPGSRQPSPATARRNSGPPSPAFSRRGSSNDDDAVVPQARIMRVPMFYGRSSGNSYSAPTTPSKWQKRVSAGSWRP